MQIHPCVKIINYSKFLYDKEKKEREARKAQTKIEIKEIRLRPKTGDHHRVSRCATPAAGLEERHEGARDHPL